MPTIHQLQTENPSAIIWTEGKTDWKHLKIAVEKLQLNLALAFHEAETSDMGGDALFNRCKTFSETLQSTPMVFIFDREDETLIRKVSDPATPFKNWGNNVFSFVLPTPDHRQGHDYICIELYYSNAEIMTQDAQGRRLFLTSEFSETSGTHKQDSMVHVGNMGKLKGTTTLNKTRIIDAQVYKNDANIALSKSDFTGYVCNEAEPFNQFKFEEFRKIFSIIIDILAVAKPKLSFALPNLQTYYTDRVSQAKSSQQLSDILETAFNVLELTMQLFIACTIRSYEDIIVEESPDYAKKVKPIRQAIFERFTAPSSLTLSDLTRYCYHLVDEKAPDELRAIKENLGRDFTLGSIGELLDDLENIFPPETTKSRLVNKANVRKGLMNYLIPEMAQYQAKLSDLSDNIGGLAEEEKPQTKNWLDALQALIDAVNPIISQVFVLESLEHVNTPSRTYRVSTRTYSNDSVIVSHRDISFEEVDRYDRNSSSVRMTQEGAPVLIHLFPFLIIKDDKLYFYKRTRAAGYECYSISDGNPHVEQTKRKFSQSVFKIGTRGSQQALFWTDVLPINSTVVF